MSKQFSKISVIGLGYVGLPLSCNSPDPGFRFLGLISINKKSTRSTLVRLISSISPRKSLPNRSIPTDLKPRLIPPDCPKWKPFLFAYPLLWMIIASPIFPSFWIPQERLLHTLQKACWLLWNPPPTRGQPRMNFASFWKKGPE